MYVCMYNAMYVCMYVCLFVCLFVFHVSSLCLICLFILFYYSNHPDLCDIWVRATESLPGA
jgi:hypothetical protein